MIELASDTDTTIEIEYDGVVYGIITSGKATGCAFKKRKYGIVEIPIESIVHIVQELVTMKLCRQIN